MKFDYIKKIKSTKIRRTETETEMEKKIVVCTLEQRIHYLFYISNQ